MNEPLASSNKEVMESGTRSILASKVKLNEETLKEKKDSLAKVKNDLVSVKVSLNISTMTVTELEVALENEKKSHSLEVLVDFGFYVYNSYNLFQKETYLKRKFVAFLMAWVL